MSCRYWVIVYSLPAKKEDSFWQTGAELVDDWAFDPKYLSTLRLGLTDYGEHPYGVRLKLIKVPSGIRVLAGGQLDSVLEKKWETG